jgi:cellulose biosynthesis protein BcsQ
MLTPDSHSDVVELCRWTEMNPANYRRFESPLTSDTAEQPETPASPVDDHTQEPIAADPKEPATSIKTTTTLRVDCPPTPFQHSPMQHQLVALANAHDRAAAEPSVLPLISGVGGCGVTTVLATLGRALSILGERVLLVDTESQSTLPCAYEARAEGRGLLLSTDPLSRFEGQVHVLRTSSPVTTAAQSGLTRFHRAMAELAGRLDRVVIAGGELLTPALKAQHATARNVSLVVLTPELRSALAAPGILRSFGSDAQPWFLLNRFDGENSRHVQFRLQLQHSLGERLLPFCIPQSSSVEDALLKGVTVLDLVPQSAIADAFFELAEWYRIKCGVETSCFRASEETQLAVSNEI